MDRREVLKSLLALPMVKSIEVAEVKPTDVIVVECDQYLTDEVIARMQAQFGTVWPGRKVVVFDKGTRMRIARELAK